MSEQVPPPHPTATGRWPASCRPAPVGPPPAAPPGQRPLPPDQERLWAMLAHLLSFVPPTCSSGSWPR